MKIIALLFSFFLLSCSSPPRPSIIMIMVDTLRADMLGAYGFEGPISPHMDSFANESIVFERAVSQSPWTKPAIATLFTSLYPETHRVTDHFGLFQKEDPKQNKTSRLSDSATTLAEILKAHGYITAAFVQNTWISSKLGFAQGFDVYMEEKKEFDPFDWSPGRDKIRDLMIPIRNTFESWFKEANPTSHAFLYFHYMDVHGPYICSDEDVDVLKESASLGSSELISTPEIGRIPRYVREDLYWPKSLSKNDVRDWRTCYAAGVRAFDREFSKLVSSLQTAGVWESSIVVVLSDHGEEFHEHQDWEHGHSLYRELIDVPLMIRLPQAKGAGRRVSRLVGLIDVMPTLLDMVGISRSNLSLQGKSFRAALKGRRLFGSPTVYASGVQSHPEFHSVQANQFKLIVDPVQKKDFLFELDSDPHEMKNLNPYASKPLENLSQRRAKVRKEIQDQPRLEMNVTSLSEDEAEKLRSLGYLQ